MRIFKATYKDRNGKSRESVKWYGEFRDHIQIIRRIPLLTDKTASAETGRKIERLVALKASGDSPDRDLSYWIAEAPPHVKARLVDWGIVDITRVGLTKSLAAHLLDYKTDIAMNGNSTKHASVSHARAKRVVDGCHFRSVADINSESVKAFLSKLWKQEDIGAKSYGYYVRDMKAFCKWLVRGRRARENALEHLEGLGSKALSREALPTRRPLTVAEIGRLLLKTETESTRFGMSGPERALVYRLAIETGLRSAEVASLLKSSFRLDEKVAAVFVPGSHTKNAHDADLPLRPQTVELLRKHLAMKLPTAKAFAMPPSTETARMIRADLAAADIPAIDSAGRKVDFHALRHTFLTLLASSGVHPKVAQDLARHSDINLTLSRYSHTVLEQRSEAVRRLPEFPAGSESERATGTENK